MTLKTATPAQIDGELFPIWTKLDTAERRAIAMRHSVDVTLGEIALATDNGRSASYDENYTLPGQIERLEDQEQEVRDLEAAAEPFENEWAERRWVRYIIVAGGHLHFSTCHTLTPGRTMAGAVAEASGLDQDQVVGHFGETACTHCFPDAPVAKPKTPAEEGFCSGSGHTPDANRHFSGGRYGACQTCGYVGSITTRGVLRKHKAEAAG